MRHDENNNREAILPREPQTSAGLGEALRDLLGGKPVSPNLTAPTAPVANQDGFPPVEQVVGSWADTNGCPDTPTHSKAGTDVELRVYSPCDEDTAIDFYVVADGGHAWPGSKIESLAGHGGRAAIIGFTTMQVDATNLIWSFFKRYALSS